MNILNFGASILTLSFLFAVSAQGSSIPGPGQPAFSIEAEGQSLWQGRNDVAIPGDTGTRFSLGDVIQSPVFGIRVEPTYLLAERHQLRGVFAPLSLADSGRLSRAVNFQGQNFNAGQEVEAVYQFNSYRLTYRYAFVLNEDWSFFGGFTGKIRDAAISLRQGSQFQEKTNVGFVPLLHAAVAYRFASLWQAELELDALAAPQGRAEDVRIGIRRGFEDSGLSLAAGYRLLEGGADNEEVFSFAFFHYAFISAAYSF